MSFTHVDTGGVGTVVIILEGCKVWFVGTPMDASDDVMSPNFAAFNGYKPFASLRWEALALKKGDVL